jgi:hypothetical protein
LTGADVLIVLVLLGSTVIGLARGFVREAVSLVLDRSPSGRHGNSGPWSSRISAAAGRSGRAPWVGRLVVLVRGAVVGWVVGMLLSYFTRSLGLGVPGSGHRLLFGICAAWCWSA